MRLYDFSAGADSTEPSPKDSTFSLNKRSTTGSNPPLMRTTSFPNLLYPAAVFELHFRYLPRLNSIPKLTMVAEQQIHSVITEGIILTGTCLSLEKIIGSVCKTLSRSNSMAIVKIVVEQKIHLVVRIAVRNHAKFLLLRTRYIGEMAAHLTSPRAISRSATFTADDELLTDCKRHKSDSSLAILRKPLL